MGAKPLQNQSKSREGLWRNCSILRKEGWDGYMDTCKVASTRSPTIDIPQQVWYDNLERPYLLNCWCHERDMQQREYFIVHKQDSYTHSKMETGLWGAFWLLRIIHLDTNCLSYHGIDSQAKSVPTPKPLDVKTVKEVFEGRRWDNLLCLKQTLGKEPNESHNSLFCWIEEYEGLKSREPHGRWIKLLGGRMYVRLTSTDWMYTLIADRLPR